ncbi:hypothetical protein AAV99_07970 [Aurantiacibacter marinus]|uniref:TIGR04222 domain-containing membrane protein n=1 Tax=Aurantiacibacter marinus TaxID=874156 RepID=A0A0H0XPX4_9SPHN|nr:hypothetical protein AAV99_07970 [Aurantiacibacter marinus]
MLFYVLLFAASAGASIFITIRVRPDGRTSTTHDAAELAYLAGGERRLTEATLASLIAADAVKVTADRKLWSVQAGAGETAPEKAVSRITGDFGLKAAHKAIIPHARKINADLVRKGLLMDDSERFRLRMMAAIPFLLILAVGMWRLLGGVLQGAPVGFLVALMVVTVVVMIVRVARMSPLTVAGENLLDQRYEEQSRLRAAPRGSEMGMGVALFGTAILVGTPFSELHAMKAAAGANGVGGYAGDGGDSGDGGGSDGGGSGCGGGGCGGCGG